MTPAVATQAITTVLTLVNAILVWADPLVNPLSAQATVITYLIDLAIVVPVAIAAFRTILGLVGRRSGRRA